MASTSLVDSTKRVSALRDVRDLLQLVHHRNRNQHHVAAWWRPFGVLRRNVGRLVEDITAESEETNKEKRDREKKRKKAGKSDVGEAGRRGDAETGPVVERVSFLDEHVIPKCYLAFSEVVADPQYAPLGLMLLATLARLRSLTMPWRRSLITEIAMSRDQAPKEAGPDEDLGVTIARTELNTDHEENGSSTLRDNSPHNIGEAHFKRQSDHRQKEDQKGRKLGDQPGDGDEKDKEDGERRDIDCYRDDVPERKDSDAVLSMQRDGDGEGTLRATRKPTTRETISTVSSTTTMSSKAPKKKKRKKGDAFDDLFSNLM